MIDTITKLPLARVLTFAVVLSIVICPGFVFFYRFDAPTFIALDFAKLAILALALTAPVYLFNLAPCLVGLFLAQQGVCADTLSSQLNERSPEYATRVAEFRAAERRDHRNLIRTALVSAAVLSVLPLYLPLVFGSFLPLSFRAGVAVAWSVQTVVSILSIMFVYRGLTRPQRHGSLA